MTNEEDDGFDSYLKQMIDLVRGENDCVCEMTILRQWEWLYRGIGLDPDTHEESLRWADAMANRPQTYLVTSPKLGDSLSDRPLVRLDSAFVTRHARITKTGYMTSPVITHVITGFGHQADARITAEGLAACLTAIDKAIQSQERPTFSSQPLMTAALKFDASNLKQLSIQAFVEFLHSVHFAYKSNGYQPSVLTIDTRYARAAFL